MAVPEDGVAEVEGDDTAVCRICLCGSDVGELVAPCACQGSQKWVHGPCLDKWRSSGGSAYRVMWCGICRQKYSSLPPPLPPPSSNKASFISSLLQALPLALLLYLITPSWLCTMICLLTVSYKLQGIRIVYHNDLPVIICSGDPVATVVPGMSLVSKGFVTNSTASPFSKSVILLVDHVPSVGSFGIIVNRKATGDGGPVDRRLCTYYGRDECPGGSEILPGLWVETHKHLEDHPERDGYMVVGYAGWAPRQLDGEIRQGRWALSLADPEELLSLDGEEMWKVLLERAEREKVPVP